MTTATTEQKSPWNPSVRATARVKNPLPVPTACPHCSAAVEIMNHDRIYGVSYSKWPWVFACTGRGCGAYVGMHPFTCIPLGTLATAALRSARRHCKPNFEALFLIGGMSRTEAYQALAAKLGIPFEECHFGWFDIDMCERAKAASIEIMRERMA